MKLIDVDIAADPWLLEQPVCVYRNELVKEPYHNITLRAHERLHALIYKIREEQRQKGDDPRGSGGLPNFWLVWEITKEFDPKYGPNDFRSLDGLGYGWEKLAKVKGWRTDGTFGDGDVTEVLARVAEMEAAEATHNVGYVLECNLRLQNLMLDVISQVEESRRQPPKKKKFDGWTERFNYEPEDFNKFHRRIAIKFGTVENFVRHAAETYKKSLRTERSWRPTNRTG